VKARVAGFGDPDATDERFAQLEGNLSTIGRQLRDRAPACRVLFVDYLTILPPPGGDRSGPPPAEIAEWGRAVAADELISWTAQGRWAAIRACSASRPTSRPPRAPLFRSRHDDQACHHAVTKDPAYRTSATA
jgi:hypothetical protein